MLESVDSTNINHLYNLFEQDFIEEILTLFKGLKENMELRAHKTPETMRVEMKKI